MLFRWRAEWRNLFCAEGGQNARRSKQPQCSKAFPSQNFCSSAAKRAEKRFYNFQSSADVFVFAVSWLLNSDAGITAWLRLALQNSAAVDAKDHPIAMGKLSLCCCHVTSLRGKGSKVLLAWTCHDLLKMADIIPGYISVREYTVKARASGVEVTAKAA